MKVEFDFIRILYALVIAFLAVLAYLAVIDILKWPLWVALWAFGFVLLALSVTFIPQPRA